jgi:alpha-galactosidase
MRAVYQRMGEALAAAGRPMVYSLCQYGRANVGEWGPRVAGNLWRTTMDIRDAWDSMASIGFAQHDWAKFARPGAWNDPDMLEIGNGGLSDTESRAHFSLWAMLAAPLLAGNDVRSMSPATKAILLNRAVIAVNQDPLGQPARRSAVQGDVEIWTRPLAGGAYALAAFNRGAAEATVDLDPAAHGAPGRWRYRDLWTGQTLARPAGAIPAHGVLLLRLEH